MNIERRFLQTSVTTAAGTLRGTVRYNVESALLTVNGRTFVEVIAPGAFKRSLASGQNVMLTAGHMSDDPLNCIGRWPSGGLTLTDTSVGLDWSGVLPDTVAARDLHQLVKSGVIQGASFEFVVDARGETWTKKDGQEIRTITSARLLEINPCAAPAYAANNVEARRRSHASDPVTAPRFSERDYWAARLGIPLL